MTSGPDFTNVERLEIVDDPRVLKLVGSTLQVGRGYFRDSLVNEETGSIYFPEGHFLYDFFCHNEPARRKILD